MLKEETTVVKSSLQAISLMMSVFMANRWAEMSSYGTPKANWCSMGRGRSSAKSKRRSAPCWPVVPSSIDFSSLP